MSPEELAKIVGILLDSAKFTQSQRYELLGRVDSIILNVKDDSSKKAVVAQESQKAADPSPAQAQPSGRVMIPKGFDCTCDICKATVYRIGKDVLENMPKKDFVGCFLPLSGAPELAMPLDTWSDSGGNIAIDCPLCKGRKSLWIKGKGDMPYNDYPESTGPDLNTR